MFEGYTWRVSDYLLYGVLKYGKFYRQKSRNGLTDWEGTMGESERDRTRESFGTENVLIQKEKY